jgi:hypothetical protein
VCRRRRRHASFPPQGVACFRAPTPGPLATLGTSPRKRKHANTAHPTPAQPGWAYMTREGWRALLGPTPPTPAAVAACPFKLAVFPAMHAALFPLPLALAAPVTLAVCGGMMAAAGGMACAARGEPELLEAARAVGGEGAGYRGGSGGGGERGAGGLQGGWAGGWGLGGEGGGIERAASRAPRPRRPHTSPPRQPLPSNPAGLPLRGRRARRL